MIHAAARRLRAIVNSPRVHVALTRPWTRRVLPGTPRSFLVFQTNHIGDFVLGTPLLVALREAYPAAKIHLAVVQGLAELARSCPLIDSVTVLPDGLAFWGPASQVDPRRIARLAWIAATRLRTFVPDVAIVPRRNTDAHGAAILALFSGAPRRIGFGGTGSAGRTGDSAGFETYFTDPVAVPGPIHEVLANRAVATAAGIALASWEPCVWHSVEDAAAVDRLFDDANVSRGRLVVFAPGAAAAFRRWPAGRFAEVGRAVVADGNTPSVVIAGSTADRESAAEIRALMPDGTCHDFTGRLHLGQTVALLRRAALFVGNDSGPLHLAAAAGVPCVEVSSFPGDGDPSHPNSPVRFGPWGVPRRVLQPAMARRPCQRACSAGEAHCILDVEPSAVIEAVRQLLSTPHATSDLR
ncbi:MAG: glycosyltransferase family 9 protein [Planctomycetes bacterium]|nr:glycosyltransferase family 9 protein [Planctomycetota bacterium]